MVTVALVSNVDAWTTWDPPRQTLRMEPGRLLWLGLSLVYK